MSLQDVLYKLSKIESAVDNINLRLCSLENNLNRPLRSFNQRIPRNIYYSSNLPPQTNIPQTNMPQTNIPQTYIPQTNIHQTNIPESNIPQPNTTQPNITGNNETRDSTTNNQEQNYIQPSLFSYFNTRNPRRTEQIEISLSNPGPNLFDTLFPGLNRRSENLQNHRTINQNTELSVYFKEDQNDNEDNEDICAICQEVIENNSIIRKIKTCNHFFHSTCLDTWLEDHVTCPSCRQDITTNTNSENENQNNQNDQNHNDESNSSNQETII